MPDKSELSIGEQWIMDKVEMFGEIQRESDAKMDRRFVELNKKIDDNFVTRKELEAKLDPIKRIVWGTLIASIGAGVAVIKEFILD